jgi:hypothetical protein
MFDLAENNFMSELQSSFALRRIEEKYHPPDATLSLLSNRSLNASTHNRYASSGAMTKEQFRNKHQIPEDGKVFAIFTHGEPSINTLLCPTVREIHGISEEILNFRIAEVCQELARRGFWVVVQEHPFNCKFGKTVKLPEYSRLIRTEENVSTVLNVADHYLFTLSTIQFDAVFLGKSFGLLCKSALFSNGAPWLFSDFESAGDFLDAIQDGVAWRSVQFKIQRRCAFLYDYFLLDIGPTKVKEAGEQFALQMATFSRQSKPDFPENFSRFVGKWITLGNVLPA